VLNYRSSLYQICGGTFMYSKSHKSLVIFVFLLLLSQTIFAQTPTETPTILELNKSIEREIKGGENQEYQLNLRKGQYLKLEITEKGIEVVVSVKNPIGELVLDYDVPFTKDKPQPLNFVANSSGIYVFQVHPVVTKATSGRYQISMLEIRDASETDILRFKALELNISTRKLREAGKLDEAIADAQKAIAIIKQINGEDTIEVVDLVSELGSIYDDKKDVKKAEEYYLKALELYQKAFGKDHPFVATTLGNLGVLYYGSGNYEKAEDYYLKCLEIQEKIFGKDDLNVATWLSSLGVLYYVKGDYSKAEQLHLRALAIRESKLSSDDTAIALSNNNLAVLYRIKGDYVRAFQMMQHTLSIYEKNLPPDNLDLATIISNMAALSVEVADYVSAEKYFQRAITIREAKLGPDNPTLAQSLNNFGGFYEARGETDKALALYERCLAIYEKSYGKEHPEVARSLNNISGIYRGRGDFDKAEPLQLRALEIYKNKLGAAHTSVGTSYNNLGLIAQYRKEYDKAEKYLKDALAIMLNANGENYLQTGFVRRNLATLYLEKKDFEQALKIQKQLLESHEKTLDIGLSIGSERQKSAFLETLTYDLRTMLALQADLLPNSQEIKATTLKLILERKGRRLDVLSNDLQVIRKNLTPQDQQIIDQLGDINAKLANQTIGGAGRDKPEIYSQRMQKIEVEKDKLEAQLSEKSSSYRSVKKSVTIESVRSSIPENALLIEFIVDTPLDRTNNLPKPKFLPSRYIVFTLNRQGEIKSKILGDKLAIDDSVKKFRNAIHDSKSTNVKQLARDLDKKIMSPIREFLGDSTQLLVSPDGDLNLIPFEALVDESGKYLVEKYSISYISSGRDLLRMQNSKPNTNSPLIIANPDFGISEITGNTTDTAVAKRNPKDKKRGVTVAKSLSETYFAPLSGTEQEGKTIQTLFPESTLLTGDKATKDALKLAKSPKILHIASHGFYLEDKEKSNSENPLLRSGIALAGANAHKENNGIVTALEATGLNLFGTKLVVLSACGTGLGEVQSGEGVFGLRRSFVLSGTESLVISLWSVSDYVTRELMTNYYKNLKLGNGRGESLRKVQLEMIKNPKRQHPFYWASFIQSGNWKALDK
jgi:CHAT domain-containing protein/Flp pilus assembly protein TadD